MKIIVILAISSLLASFTAFADNNDLENEWRSLDVKKTVLLILPHGKVVIELAPQFSPTHVKQFIKLVKSGHYNGNKFIVLSMVLSLNEGLTMAALLINLYQY
ncbi:peptidylprolyl isomerase [Colwellia sp. MB02u-14]|uniref:peptidylprolyl isomerase n=1 Tax=Colwellia sp. MB02u-14 TaxID=2759815 RepID=UPI0021753437|nr:peptidylprolyl isomerase [Colwellia sp. MB02u-14]